MIGLEALEVARDGLGRLAGLLRQRGLEVTSLADRFPRDRILGARLVRHGLVREEEQVVAGSRQGRRVVRAAAAIVEEAQLELDFGRVLGPVTQEDLRAAALPHVVTEIPGDEVTEQPQEGDQVGLPRPIRSDAYIDVAEQDLCVGDRLEAL